MNYHSLLENLALSGLRVSKVNKFIQKFVDDDKVVSNTLLFNLLKILAHNLNKLVQEWEDHGSICIAPGDADDVQVLMLDVHERAARSLNQRGDISFLFPFHEQWKKLINDAHFHVSSIVSWNEHLP